VGDPPNVVISQRLGVGFVDYLAYNGPLVFVMLPVAVAVQFYRFRPMLKTSTTLDAKAIERLRAEHPIVDERSLLYVGICLCTLFLALFLTEVTHVEPAFSCFLMMVYAASHLPTQPHLRASCTGPPRA
jgi:Na+/H+ antiporter NhaD/arsenite permease-like protein